MHPTTYILYILYILDIVYFKKFILIMCEADTEYQNIIYKNNDTLNSPPDLGKEHSYYFEVLCGTQ